MDREGQGSSREGTEQTGLRITRAGGRLPVTVSPCHTQGHAYQGPRPFLTLRQARQAGQGVGPPESRHEASPSWPTALRTFPAALRPVSLIALSPKPGGLNSTLALTRARSHALLSASLSRSLTLLPG